MMVPAEILSELQRLRVELRADGDRLRLRPRGAVPPELREAIIRHKDELLAHVRKSEDQSNLTPTAAEPCLPESVLTARYPLAVLCRTTLDSLPAAHELSVQERRIVADAMEAAVMNWLARIVLPPEEVIRDGSQWDARCPKNHSLRDGVFARQLLGWSCLECEQVFPASECRLRIGEGQ